MMKSHLTGRKIRDYYRMKISSVDIPAVPENIMLPSGSTCAAGTDAISAREKLFVAASLFFCMWMITAPFLFNFSVSDIYFGKEDTAVIKREINNYVGKVSVLFEKEYVKE